MPTYLHRYDLRSGEPPLARPLLMLLHVELQSLRHGYMPRQAGWSGIAPCCSAVVRTSCISHLVYLRDGLEREDESPRPSQQGSGASKASSKQGKGPAISLPDPVLVTSIQH